MIDLTAVTKACTKLSLVTILCVDFISEIMISGTLTFIELS